MKKDLQERGEKLFRKLRFSKSFQTGVHDIRKDFNIENNGFDNTEQLASWGAKISQNQSRKLDRAINAFLIKQRLPLNTWWRYRTYEHIFNVEVELKIQPEGTSPFIEIFNPGYDEDGNASMLKLYDGVSQTELINYIKTYWQSIKPFHGMGMAKIIQSEKDPSTNAALMDLYAAEGKRQGSESALKELRITKKLKQRTNKNLSPEAAKMRIHRKRNAER